MRNQNIRYIEVRKPEFNADKPCFEAWTKCPFCDKYYRGFTIHDVPNYFSAFRIASEVDIQTGFSEENVESFAVEYSDVASVREFHITGICDACWTEMTRFEEFGDEFEDDELYEVVNG